MNTPRAVDSLAPVRSMYNSTNGVSRTRPSTPLLIQVPPISTRLQPMQPPSSCEPLPLCCRVSVSANFLRFHPPYRVTNKFRAGLQVKLALDIGPVSFDRLRAQV